MELMKGHRQLGILGLFKSAEALVEAIKKAKGGHLSQMEAFTPFPSHEVIHALGLKRSLIPWGTFVFGLSGAGLLFLFQAWTSSVDWPINIGGKPFISWPAFIPITFEGMVLIGGIMTVLLLFAVLRLPNRTKAVLDPRLTNDLFGLYIAEKDPNFDEKKITELMKQCRALEVKRIDAD